MSRETLFQVCLNVGYSRKEAMALLSANDAEVLDSYADKVERTHKTRATTPYDIRVEANKLRRQAAEQEKGDE